MIEPSSKPLGLRWQHFAGLAIAMIAIYSVTFTVVAIQVPDQRRAVLVVHRVVHMSPATVDR
jgi:hypothetical protein